MSESDKPSSLSLGKKITFTVIVVVGLLAIGEVAARFLVKLPVAPDGSQSHREHEQLIQVMGLPGLNATMEFDPDRFWRLRQELRDLRIAGTIRDQKIEFTVNTHGGLRNALIDPVKSKPRILALGDSCTFGLGVNDDKTWPVQLQSLLDAKGLDAEVINGGVPGYTSYQGLRFLETQGLKMKPDIVVVCFGFNDSDTWASTSDLKMAENQSLRSMDRTLANSRLYYAFQKLLRGGGTRPNQQKEKRPRLTPEEYVGMLGGIHQRCIDAGATMVLVTWPVTPLLAQPALMPAALHEEAKA